MASLSFTLNPNTNKYEATFTTTEAAHYFQVVHNQELPGYYDLEVFIKIVSSDDYFRQGLVGGVNAYFKLDAPVGAQVKLVSNTSVQTAAVI